MHNFFSVKLQVVTPHGTHGVTYSYYLVTIATWQSYTTYIEVNTRRLQRVNGRRAMAGNKLRINLSKLLLLTNDLTD